MLVRQKKKKGGGGGFKKCFLNMLSVHLRNYCTGPEIVNPWRCHKVNYPVTIYSKGREVAGY